MLLIQHSHYISQATFLTQHNIQKVYVRFGVLLFNGENIIYQCSIYKLFILIFFAKATTTGNALQVHNFEKKSLFFKAILTYVARNGIMVVICFKILHRGKSKGNKAKWNKCRKTLITAESVMNTQSSAPCLHF